MHRNLQRLMPVRVWLYVLGIAAATLAVGISTGSMFSNASGSRSEKTFQQMMAEAMITMDREMENAVMTGDPDHDFAAMMIPHHQGAVEMAKAVLLYGKDPVLRRLAQEIIVTQEQEIEVMNRRLREFKTR